MATIGEGSIFVFIIKGNSSTVVRANYPVIPKPDREDFVIRFVRKSFTRYWMDIDDPRKSHAYMNNYMFVLVLYRSRLLIYVLHN